MGKTWSSSRWRLSQMRSRRSSYVFGGRQVDSPSLVSLSYHRRYQSQRLERISWFHSMGWVIARRIYLECVCWAGSSYLTSILYLPATEIQLAKRDYILLSRPSERRRWSDLHPLIYKKSRSGIGIPLVKSAKYYIQSASWDPERAEADLSRDYRAVLRFRCKQSENTSWEEPRLESTTLSMVKRRYVLH